MSAREDINDSSITKKCGEIIITMKNNAENVYSFNCWFCDTIYIQIKKFTLHLEQEHVSQLERSTDHNKSCIVGDVCADQLCVHETETDPDSIFVTEIKIEDTASTEIKKESGDNIHVATRANQEKVCLFSSLHPLGNLENITEENSQEMKVYKQNETLNDQPTEDVEMYNLNEEQTDDVPSDRSGDENTSDSDYKTEERTKLRKNTKDKELILALIDAYYKTPQLWNTSLSEKTNLKQKEDLLQAITDDINSKLQLKLKLYTVKKKLNYICKQYEKEVQRQMDQDEAGVKSNLADLWYFDKMSFLKSIVENKISIKKKKPNHRVKPLNDNLICDLIDIYKNYNSLWDVNHLAYTVKDKRQETMQAMLGEIEKKMNLILDIYKLEKNLHYIHKSFSKDKQTKLQCEAKQMEFQPSCPYYRKCEFLEKHQGPFMCPNCNEIIESYNDYQIHKSQHDGSTPFKCQECGMGFKKITNYTIHAKRHLHVFKFHCKICGKGYPFNAELDLHMRSHTGAQPYLCSICGEGFRTAISYDNHIRRHEQRFKYLCHICKKGFNHMTRLNDHVKAHLNVRDVICTLCGKGFTSRKYLNHHKRIHEGKNYSCNICGKSFAQDAGLRAHKKYHGIPIGVRYYKKINKYNMS
ncbi:hypothetical protein DOY81_000531 [Sarcophaga bullata]|nr:hypothetical protein DOY81_000531 [Sarcophaga bullata]